MNNMTTKEIIDGLQFTIDMFLMDPSTGEVFTDPRNDLDKITIDACKGAIDILRRQEKKILLVVLNTIAENCKKTRYCKDCLFDLEGECMFYEMSPAGWNFTWLKDNMETKEV